MNRHNIFYITLITFLITSAGVSATVNNNITNSSEVNDTIIKANKNITKVNNTTETKNVTTKKNETEKYPTISGYFKPGVACDYSYTWHWKKWRSVCAFCGSENLLMNPKGVPEKEITCGYCDADFDGVTGKDKNHRNVYLTPG